MVSALFFLQNFWCNQSSQKQKIIQKHFRFLQFTCEIIKRKTHWMSSPTLRLCQPATILMKVGGTMFLVLKKITGFLFCSHLFIKICVLLMVVKDEDFYGFKKNENTIKNKGTKVRVTACHIFCKQALQTELTKCLLKHVCNILCITIYPISHVLWNLWRNTSH